MTITATYMGDLSRIRVAMSAAPAGTDQALVERSTDGITWTTVAGGDAVTITAGAGFVDDYFFSAGVLNTYRASYVNSTLLPTLIGTGAIVTGNNANLVPPHPVAAAPAVGDLKVIFASIRNSGAGSVNVPAGWYELAKFGNMSWLAKRHVGGDVAPTVTFAGGVANADTLAQMVAIRNSKDTPAAAPGIQLNSIAAQDVAGPSTFAVGPSIAVLSGWKQDDMTSSALPGGWTKLGDLSSTAGDDASAFWDVAFVPRSSDGVVNNPFPIAITGGAVAISRAAMFYLGVVDNIGQETATVTPTLTNVWLKNIGRPSLNTPLIITNISEITEPARMGLHPIIGRSREVATTDVRLGQRFTLTVMVKNKSDELDLKNKLALGGPVFLQGPNGSCAIPTMYAVIGDTTRRQPSASKRSARRYVDLPLTEVAAPSSAVFSATYTYADLVVDYASYTAMIAANPTYASLIDKVSHNEVVVP